MTLQEMLNKKIKVVLSFRDVDCIEPYDGTEFETTFAELCKIKANPRNYHYDDFYILRAEEDTYYCEAVSY